MGHRTVHQLIAAVLASLPAAALAHHGTGGASIGIELLPMVLIVLMAASAFGYARGVARLWRKAGIGRGIGKSDVLRFAVGWVALAAALFSPIDDFAERSFAIHMVQHELLMVVAAPLLVVSRTFEAWAWALDATPARSALATAATWWRRLAAPRTAWWLHAAALWIWHVPVLFVAALASEALHDLQHVCFFVSALLFWWAVFGRGASGQQASSLALLITTMLHTSALGLLLTFSPTAWYASRETALFGLSALEDQQLGGLVMWVPGSLAYVIAGLVIVAAWLSPKRADMRP